MRGEARAGGSAWNRSLPVSLAVPALFLGFACPAVWSAAPEPNILSEDLLLEERAPVLEPEPPEPEQGSFAWGYSPLGVYGPTYTSPDGELRVTVGLFAWFDNTFVTDDELAGPLGLEEIDGGTSLRTAKLEVHAFYGDDFFYYFRVDFQDQGSGSGDASMEWAALGVLQLPVVQNLLVGLQQPIYGLDIWANYPRHRMFLEPSLVNAFYRGPLLAVTAFDIDLAHNIHWALGLARDTSEERLAGLNAVDTDRGSGDGLIMGRFGWAPRYDEHGTSLIYLGVSGAFFKPDDDRIGFGFYPEIFTTDPALFPFVLIDEVDDSALAVLEFRLAQGPFWLQSDYFYNRTDRKHAPDLNFDSFYVEGGWFVTGGQSAFTPLAINGQVLPAPRFDPEAGYYGALELKARYSELDLTDKQFQGGDVPGPGLNANGAEVTNLTLGVTWYLNLHLELGINFVHSVREDLGDASFDAIQTRLSWTL